MEWSRIFTGKWKIKDSGYEQQGKMMWGVTGMGKAKETTGPLHPHLYDAWLTGHFVLEARGQVLPINFSNCFSLSSFNQSSYTRAQHIVCSQKDQLSQIQQVGWDGIFSVFHLFSLTSADRRSRSKDVCWINGSLPWVLIFHQTFFDENRILDLSKM